MRAAAAVSAIVAVMVMVATAGAQGKPSHGCAPGLDPGEKTLAEALALPRVVAALADGVATVDGLTAGFEFVDNNDDGLVCVNAPRGTFNANPRSGWQYIYSLTDNDASVPSA